ncbi:MAG: AtpZ/AtpI family protein [Pyrinomonadaceae bacterium]
MPEHDEQREENRKSALAYGAAISLFASVLGFLALGWLLDRWLGTSPWLLVVGIVLGSGVGLYEFVRITSRLSQ